MFNFDCPDEWRNYEMRQQQIVNAAPLPTVKYFKSEFPNSIKMEFIDGKTLGELLLDRTIDKDAALKELMEVFTTIHEIGDIGYDDIKPYLIEGINSANTSDENKAIAIDIVNSAPDKKTLCHLDYHWLNLMNTKDGYVIIDWTNAKQGDEIFDYARTYVIMCEFAKGLKRRYLKKVYELKKYDEVEFSKAVFVMAIHRLNEFQDKVLPPLIEEMKAKFI